MVRLALTALSQVWSISGNSKTLLSATDMGRFNHTSCYIVQYSYQKDHREEHFLCQWLGQGSCEVWTYPSSVTLHKKFTFCSARRYADGKLNRKSFVNNQD